MPQYVWSFDMAELWEQSTRHDSGTQFWPGNSLVVACSRSFPVVPTGCQSVSEQRRQAGLSTAAP